MESLVNNGHGLKSVPKRLKFGGNCSRNFVEETNHENLKKFFFDVKCSRLQITRNQNMCARHDKPINPENTLEHCFTHGTVIYVCIFVRTAELRYINNKRHFEHMSNFKTNNKV